MTELADYLSVLQRGISDEQLNLAKATDEYQRYKALAGSERDKAAAFLEELGLTIRAGARRERLWSFGIGQDGVRHESRRSHPGRAFW